MRKELLRLLPDFYNDDEKLREHMETEHGGLTPEELEEFAQPGYHSLFLVHRRRHHNNLRRPWRDHFHGKEGAKPFIDEQLALVWEISEAQSESELATIATRAATQEAMNSGALSNPGIMQAITYAYSVGARSESLSDALAESIYGEEYDPDAHYGGGPHAAIDTAERAKARYFHEQRKKTQEPELPEMTPEEMRKLIEMNQQLVRELAEAAMKDSLTGLANRRLFTEQLSQQIARSTRNGESVGVVFVDLDHFKQINDTHGHDVGDELLKEVARRLEASVRAGDVVSRMGGDEFVIMLSNVDGEAGVSAVVTKLIERLSAPLELDGITIEIFASIGVAIAPKDGIDPEELVKLADQAMYSVKRDGRNGFALIP